MGEKRLLQAGSGNSAAVVPVLSELDDKKDIEEALNTFLGGQHCFTSVLTKKRGAES